MLPGYSACAKAYNTANNSKLDAGNNTYADPLQGSQSTMTQGMPTVNRVRVIENPANLTLGNWIETASFYDDKGRVIQTQSDNYKGGLETATILYDFSNKPITTYQTHTNQAAQTSISVKTNMDFDHSERLLAVRKTLNDDATNTRTITQNTYDALGQLKTKNIGQQTSISGGLTSNPLETNNYAYNIRGWLKGINWSGYGGGNATTPANSISNNQWFSMDLSYDWGYGTNQYNGNISGQRWQSAGDGAQRSFGYGYDNANRLLFADFNQQFGSSWGKSDPGNANFTIDFSVTMGDGIHPATAYDQNGNILAMTQWGLVLNQKQIKIHTQIVVKVL